MTDERAHLAEVELLGALTYGQMRAYAAAAGVAPLAPDVRAADEVVAFSEREHERYEALRTRLGELTDLPGPVMDRQRPAFDRYFDAVALDSWLTAIVFLAVGLPMAADFARAVAPTVSPRTGEVLVAALAGRGRMEQFILDALRDQLGDEEVAERARSLVAEVVGHALTSFTSTLGETDALRVLFEEHATEQGTTAESVVKHTAVEVLGAHRRRMHELGLDDLE